MIADNSGVTTATKPPSKLRGKTSMSDLSTIIWRQQVEQARAKPSDEYITTTQAASLWGVTDRTIRRWIAAGIILAHRPHHRAHYRIPANTPPPPRIAVRRKGCPLNDPHCPGIATPAAPATATARAAATATEYPPAANNKIDRRRARERNIRWINKIKY